MIKHCQHKVMIFTLLRYIYKSSGQRRPSRPWSHTRHRHVLRREEVSALPWFMTLATVKRSNVNNTALECTDGAYSIHGNVGRLNGMENSFL